MLKKILKTVLPKTWIDWLYLHVELPRQKMRIRLFGRPVTALETAKAHDRRLKNGFFDRYCQGQGLDIGHGGDRLTTTCRGWDFEDGDAQVLAGVPDESFNYVYSSHTLEHLEDVEEALLNWWRVIKSGGFLLLYLPHRDFYEKKRILPSRWNPFHRHFFLPDRDDPPDTIGIVPLIERILPNHQVIYTEVCTQGHTISDPNLHSDGEYSIEAVVKKVPKSMPDAAETATPDIPHPL